MNTQYEYNVAIGYYGGRRGTTLGILAQEFAKQIISSDKRFEGILVNVTCGGLEEKMTGKINHPIPDEHINALRTVLSQNKELEYIIDKLSNTGRKPISKEDLQKAKFVLSVDPYSLGHYLKVSEEKIEYDCKMAEGNLNKYQTVLDFIGIQQPMWGCEMDDTECPKEFEYMNIVRKVVGKDPIIEQINEANWYSITGKSYQGNSNQSRIEEAKDLVGLAYKIAERIVNEANTQRHIENLIFADPKTIIR